MNINDKSGMSSQNDENQQNSYQGQHSSKREETAFTQPEEYEDENGAGGKLGKSPGAISQEDSDDEKYSNSNGGGAGSSGAAATNDGPYTTDL